MSTTSRRDFLKAGAAAFAWQGQRRAEQPTTRPNILILIADDLGTDLGCYGNPAVRTPNLDRLSTESLRFSHAFVTSPQCSPSRSSMFTGRYPHANGCSRLHAPLPARETSIVELLRGGGYYTGAFRKHHLGPEFQKRLDFYGDARTPWTAFFDRVPRNSPFFLWAGFTDPHRPYQKGAFTPPHDPAQVVVPKYLPDTPIVREDIALYYDETARMDKESGDVLAELDRRGMARNTLVFFTSDNGMPFPRAKCTLYDSGTRVPLMARWPGKIQPGVRDDLITLVDLAPTVLEAASVRPEKAPEFQSRSFLPALLGQPYPQREFIFTERNWHDHLDLIRAVRTERYRLIQNYRPEVAYRPSRDLENSPTWASYLEEAKHGRLPEKLRGLLAPRRPEVELYDLKNDPDEMQNLAGDPARAGLIEELQQKLSVWMQETNDFLAPPIGASPAAARGRTTSP